MSSRAAASKTLGILLAVSFANCEGPAGPRGAGDPGPAGTSCTIVDGDGGKVIQCSDGTMVAISDGAPGEPGATGVSCTITDNGDDTKTISCSDGTEVVVYDTESGGTGLSCTVVDNGDGTKTVRCPDGTVATMEQGSVDIYLDPYEELPGLVLTILSVDGASRSDGTFAAGDIARVTFSIENGGQRPVDIKQLNALSIWMAGPTFNYQHILPAARDQSSYSNVATTAVDNGDGTYTYTFPAPIPANYGVPLYNTAKFSEGELTGPLAPGTYTVAMRAYKTFWIDGTSFRDVGWDTSDFLFGGASAAEKREVVADANCNACHDSVRFHGGTYRSAELCVTCHTSGSEDRNSTDTGDATPVTIDFRVMIHKIHSGAHLPSVNGVSTNTNGSRNYDATPVPYKVGGGTTPIDFSGIVFPVWPNLTSAMPRDQGYSALSSAAKTKEGILLTGVTSCEKCHGDPDGAGPLDEPAQGDQALVSNRRACGSCHDDIDWTKPYFANGQAMPAQSNDNGCVTCHQTSGASLSEPYKSLAVIEGHTHPLDDTTLSGGVEFAITGVSGGSGTNGNFVLGDSPAIDFTLKNRSGADLPLATLDATSAMVVGPTSNRQIVFPYASPNGVSISPFDFAGRLVSPSATGKAAMSKAVLLAGATKDTIKVLFSSGTAFQVFSSAGASLGTGVLSGATSTNPSGSSVSAVYLAPTLPAQDISVAFTSATAFTVTGTVSGNLGSGALPASLSSSTRFVSSGAAAGSFAFNIAAGTTAFDAGNTVRITVVETTTNPMKFALIVGRTTLAAGDRFYYDIVPPAASYTFNLPMDMPLEYLGDRTGASQALVAGNVPVYYGRETVFERTLGVGTPTALTASAASLGRYVDVASVTGLASGDYVMIDDASATAEEYVMIGRVDATLKRVWFRTPLRFAHASGAFLEEVTLTALREGSAYDYTLDPTTGTITLAAGGTAGRAIVMSYRTHARFGWYRRAGDTRQAIYPVAINGTDDLGETWGDWTGKSFVDGTYTAAIWGAQNIDLGRHGELQTYRGTSEGALKDFLFGGATELQDYALISSVDNCYSCHNYVIFHGGGRRSVETCLLCHGASGGEDWPQWGTTTTGPATTGVTISFRTMLHKIHNSEELQQRDYTVAGNSGSSNVYNEIVFPTWPGGAKHCTKCHGDSDVWQSPTDRNHPTEQGQPVRAWAVTCGSCHDSTGAQAHIEINTANSGAESCDVCHGPGRELEVELVHKNR